MCIALPGLVVALTDTGALIETNGSTRRAQTLLLPEVRVGDHVIVSAGFIVERLTAEEADERRRWMDEFLALAESGDGGPVSDLEDAEA